MGHSGSTLLDSILGTHPQIISSGEMRYLGWQLWRTRNKKSTIKDQDICTCNKGFRECNFWSIVFQEINSKTGINISKEPKEFKINFFNQFGYKDRGRFADRIKGYIIRRYLENGWSMKLPPWIESEIEKILKNNWLLYETMTKVSNRPIVVDSSKHLTRGLLLQKSRPKDVWFIFIHRSIHSLVNSSKRWKNKTSIKQIVDAKKLFERRVELYKRKVSSLNYIDVDYEEFVKAPSSFLENVVKQLGADLNYPNQDDDNFFIDPSRLHLVAGNPMRYKGKQLVKKDDRWKNELTKSEMNTIDDLYIL